MSFGENLKRVRLSRGLTQQQVADKMDITKSTYCGYETGKRQPDVQKIKQLSQILGVQADELLETGHERDFLVPGLSPLPASKSYPLLGDIACGTPILAEENISEYIQFPGNLNADYCLRCHGDSMIDARIHDGDIVFIRQQSEVENGEIAAILIGEEATLKRVYFDNNTLTLMAANPAYPPKTYTGEQLSDVRILGKAVYFLSMVK